MRKRMSVKGMMVLLIMLFFALAQSSASAEQAAGDANGNNRHGGRQVAVKSVDIKRGSKSISSIQTELGGTAILLKAAVKPANASDKSVSWSSSNTDVAIVNAEGKVIVFGAGETTVTATAKDGSGKSDSVLIQVGANGSTYTSKDKLPKHNDGSMNTVQDFLGVNFINPQYSFGTSDAILEGGERLRQLNTKSIKMYLSPNYKNFYQFNDWSGTAYTSPAELAESDSFKGIFDMDFNTYFLGAYVFSEPKYATYWFTGFSDEQKQKEYDQIYELAVYLLKTYRGTGKTFILQNWEGDWSTMAAPNIATDPDDDVLKRMTEWINIRQNAVNDAREAVKSRNVHIYNALEVNLVKKAMEGGKTVTNQVIPNTYCDYYSYSAYDTPALGKEVFGNALDYLKAKVAQNLNNGRSRVFVGEFSLAENVSGTKQVLEAAKTVVETAREKQIDHALFWQLYDDSVGPNQPDDQYSGFWLVKPSGKKTAAWAYFYGLLNNGAEDPEYVPEPPANYSTLQISLGAANAEKGLQQHELADGLTTAGAVSGRQSRTTTGAVPSGYMYFAVDRDYLTEDDRDVTIEVTYFDEGTTSFALEYESASSAPVSLQVSRTGTNKWLTRTFQLADARFAGGLSGGADFRLADLGVPLSVSLVRASKPIVNQDEISIVLKEYPLQQGILLKPLSGYDGAVVNETIGGRAAYATDPSNVNNPGRADNNHMYFDADDDFIPSTQEEVYVEVTYYDLGTSPFELQYNSTLPDDAPNYFGLATPIEVLRTNTEQWVTHTFHITNAEFANKLQNGFADFRLSDKGDKLYVSKIVIKKHA
ncbi:Ig-like domain-containing protein [Paenibacillus contaminans]|nr:Ig-like domain-containing protein [Paenibacillus contaminans]